MTSNLRPLLLAAVLAVCACAGALLVPSPAVAGGGVKFFIVEWRLTWDRSATATAEDGTSHTVLSLDLKGRASLDGRDFDKDFQMEVKDATPFLDILRTCGTGRMAGIVDDYDTEGGVVVGRRLENLNCRAILK